VACLYRHYYTALDIVFDMALLLSWKAVFKY